MIARSFFTFARMVMAGTQSIKHAEPICQRQLKVHRQMHSTRHVEWPAGMPAGLVQELEPLRSCPPHHPDPMTSIATMSAGRMVSFP